MNGEHIEYFQVCYMADKKFNEARPTSEGLPHE